MLKRKLGEQEAKLFINFLESQVEQGVQHQISSLATKEDLVKEIASTKSDLTRQIYIVGLIQFLAIVGSVIGIFSFMFQK
jgi:hypothetical protein